MQKEWSLEAFFPQHIVIGVGQDQRGVLGICYRVMLKSQTKSLRLENTKLPDRKILFSLGNGASY